MTQTQSRFLSLWSRSGGTQAKAAYADLASRYGEPIRHYHTLNHVRRCLRYLDWARHEIPDIDAVEMALWCHDVIYVPGAHDNEQRSVEWFQHWARGRIAAAERICRMILDTVHDSIPASQAGRFAVDIDLAVLGCTRTRFLQNAAFLRAERPDLDDVAYDAAERAFLSALLSRPSIYLTDPFRARFEAAARLNLSCRLAQPVPREAGSLARRR
jgi:predicted metal-dependent HD superfamily phosphohydrolase